MRVVLAAENPQTGCVSYYTALPGVKPYDADTALPADWDWKEAFYLEMKVGDISKKVVLVPFAEAGNGKMISRCGSRPDYSSEMADRGLIFCRWGALDWEVYLFFNH